MMNLMTTAEHYARYVVGLIAVIAVSILAAYQMNWITSSADYRVGSWYLIDARGSFYLSTEYADRQTCFDHLRTGQICKPGSDMVARELAEQDARVAASRRVKERS